MNPFQFRPPGAIVSHDVDNAGLVADVWAAAQVGAQTVRGGLPRHRAARMAYMYCRDHAAYLEETDPDQQLPRMPWRFVADGVGDCKSTAIFIASVCRAAGCRVALRFCTFAGDNEPGHVYAVIDGRPVDPLVPFGQECPHVSAFDLALA